MKVTVAADRQYLYFVGGSINVDDALEELSDQITMVRLSNLNQIE